MGVTTLTWSIYYVICPNQYIFIQILQKYRHLSSMYVSVFLFFSFFSDIVVNPTARLYIPQMLAVIPQKHCGLIFT